MMRRTKEARLRTLTSVVNAVHKDLHNIDFFCPRPTVRENELRVLRRWNSHTPMLQYSYGGGYLLRWKGKGTVIDPGVTFLDIFQQPHPLEGLNKPHRMQDIDLVVVTHDHADHCEDVGMLLVFLHNYNKWRKKKGLPPHIVDFAQSLGAHFRSVILLDNANTRQSVHAIDVPPPPSSPPAAPPTQPADPLRLRTKYHMELKEISADHTEVLGSQSALGFRISLLGGTRPFIYCDTGDTKYHTNLADKYLGADLLLLHVGTMHGPNGEHLCFDGVVNILKIIEQNVGRHGRPKLVLLGEWGEEFRCPDSRKECAALAKEFANYQGPVLPADLGMRINLDDDCSVWCPTANRWVPPDQVEIDDWGQWIEYHER
jgi:ribonuclease BN (tRNA processing enzyme)